MFPDRSVSDNLMFAMLRRRWSNADEKVLWKEIDTFKSYQRNPQFNHRPEALMTLAEIKKDVDAVLALNLIPIQQG